MLLNRDYILTFNSGPVATFSPNGRPDNELLYRLHHLNPDNIATGPVRCNGLSRCLVADSDADNVGISLVMDNAKVKCTQRLPKQDNANAIGTVYNRYTGMYRMLDQRKGRI